MRKIGNIQTEEHARRFAAYLLANGVATQVDTARDSTWEIWVLDDSHLEPATVELEHFLAAPDDPRYREGARTAEKIKKQQEAATKRSRTRIIDARAHWGIFHDAGLGALTLAIILLCVGLYILQQTGGGKALEALFMITTREGVMTREILPEVKSGQVWRLLTPILLHGGIIHLVFNMMWIRRFGSSIENIEGSLHLLAQVIVYAVVSNLVQYFTGSPFFYGMSGVVYGLFGYVWICSKHDPARAYVLEKDTVVLMIIWFVLCFTGLVGPIANGAHAGGFLAGILWATVTVRQIPFTKVRF